MGFDGNGESGDALEERRKETSHYFGRAIMMKMRYSIAARLLLLFLLARFREAAGSGPAPYLVCVSNERSGDVTIIDGVDRKVLATVAVGKRPRGIHASPDG